MKSKKMWALLVHLSMHFSYGHYDTLPVDQDFWRRNVEKAAKSGMNTILLEVCDGVEYLSRPEIAMPGAWSITKLKKELEYCRSLGLTVIPKLNFAATHSNWMGKYRRMISSEEYYHVCYDLIKEIYELFDHPEYIHIGMDEEDEEHARYNKQGYCMFRRGDLYWHDLRYLVDCVKSTGAKPWIWYDAFINHHETYVEKFDMDEVLLSPWYYHHLKEEEFVPFSEFKFDRTPYAGMDLQYIEDIPRLKSFRQNILGWAKEGYPMVPCAWSKKPGNIRNLMEYFHNGAPDEQFMGMIVSTWCPLLDAHQDVYDTAFQDFAAAKSEFYPD